MADDLTNVEALLSLDPLEFEQLVAQAWERQGFVVESTPASGDEGIDLIAVKDDGFNTRRIAIQCKRHSNPVGRPAAQGLMGAISSDPRYSEAILVAVSGFTEQCKEYARGQGRLQLVDGAMLCQMLGGLDLDVEVAERNLFKVVEAGDLNAVQRLEAVRRLLDQGADANAREDGMTLLHQAAWLGRTNTTRLLIERGADVNAKSHTSGAMTPLHTATLGNRTRNAQLLLEHGADVNAHDQNGSTPLHWVGLSDQTEVAVVLLKHRADVNARNLEGSTPLHVAAFQGHPKVAALLLEHGARVNVQNEYGSTPLHTAAFNGHPEVAALLLRHGADVNAMDKEGATPWSRAFYRRDADSQGHHETASLLARHAAKLEADAQRNLRPAPEKAGCCCWLLVVVCAICAWFAS